MTGTPHDLGSVRVDLGEVTTLDVVAEDFDDAWQEQGALAAVREVAAHARGTADLAAPLHDILAPDEHGPFNGEVVGVDAAGTARVRLVHEHTSDGEQ